jgi:hypothetical protein
MKAFSGILNSDAESSLRQMEEPKHPLLALGLGVKAERLHFLNQATELLLPFPEGKRGDQPSSADGLHYESLDDLASLAAAADQQESLSTKTKSRRSTQLCEKAGSVLHSRIPCLRNAKENRQGNSQEEGFEIEQGDTSRISASIGSVSSLPTDSAEHEDRSNQLLPSFLLPGDSSSGRSPFILPPPWAILNPFHYIPAGPFAATSLFPSSSMSLASFGYSGSSAVSGSQALSQTSNQAPPNVQSNALVEDCEAVEACMVMNVQDSLSRLSSSCPSSPQKGTETSPENDRLTTSGDDAVTTRKRKTPKASSSDNNLIPSNSRPTKQYKSDTSSRSTSGHPTEPEIDSRSSGEPPSSSADSDQEDAHERAATEPTPDPVPQHVWFKQLRKRTRIVKDAEQTAALEAEFKRDPIPSRKAKQRLSAQLGLSVRTIQVWFQNRRAKEKKQKQAQIQIQIQRQSQLEHPQYQHQQVQQHHQQMALISDLALRQNLAAFRSFHNPVDLWLLSGRHA